jgi:xylan 1,4-beta-xylosidase
MHMIRLTGVGVILAAAAAVALFQAQTAAPAPMAVTITVDAGQSLGALKPIWRWNGYDEPNYTYAPNGKKLVSQFQGDRNSPFGPAYFRAHNLLTTGDGAARLKWGSTNAYTEDANGNPVYSWTILDKIFDTYIDVGAKPYVQIGFMPKALSLRPEPYEHKWSPSASYNTIYTGWTTPPNNYDKWRELNFQWAKHCVEKYGMAEVKTWYWEVWNEPNIGYLTAATTGGNKTVDYMRIWDYAADGIRRAIPDAIIAGAETAGDGGQFQRDFIEHCINGTNYATGQKGSPLGMISFHAKGSPVGGLEHVRMGVQAQLATIQTGFRIVTSRPETAKLPVVIGESDPDGCAACQSYKGLYPQYGYRNGSIFAAYTAEQLVRTMDMAKDHNVNLLGAVTWAFEFEDQPIFGGFRALATDGVALPVLQTFRMLNMMGTQRVAASSTGDLGLPAIIAAPARRGGGGGTGGGSVRGEKSDVMALASKDEKRITIFSFNYHDDEVAGPAAEVTLNVGGIPAGVSKVTLTEWRVDETYSNAHTVWKKMGSPEKPSAEQHKALEAASELATVQKGVDVAVAGGKATVKVALPRESVSLVELSW